MNALKLVGDRFEKDQGEWSYNVQAVYYDPDAIETREDEEGGDTEEIIDWNYERPENKGDVDEDYSCEICPFEFAWIDAVQREPKLAEHPYAKKIAEKFFNIGRYSKKD